MRGLPKDSGFFLILVRVPWVGLARQAASGLNEGSKIENRFSCWSFNDMACRLSKSHEKEKENE